MKEHVNSKNYRKKNSELDDKIKLEKKKNIRQKKKVFELISSFARSSSKRMPRGWRVTETTLSTCAPHAKALTQPESSMD